MFHFDRVSKQYSDQPHVTDAPPILSDLSLHIPAHQFVCVLGPSGCGKTTLLNLAAGFIQPSQGRITFARQPINGPSPHRGVVFQDATLFPWLNVLGNVLFGLRHNGYSKNEAKKQAELALQQVGMQQHAKDWPAMLSGGMRQRVAIARILALKPQALLMDEPFSALDANSREHLQDTLLELWQREQHTVLYITHSVEEAAYLADRVLIFGPAPHNLHTDMVIDMPRPRLRSSMAIQKLTKQLREQLNQLPCCLKPCHRGEN
ncbi:MAG: ABC transporter ATP-binding protein [Desulfuromonadaceae bacterium]|nr:ABC transporter ATP-binding protein [Desulfuromonadaceae bacterium]